MPPHEDRGKSSSGLAQSCSRLRHQYPVLLPQYSLYARTAVVDRAPGRRVFRCTAGIETIPVVREIGRAIPIVVQPVVAVGYVDDSENAGSKREEVDRESRVAVDHCSRRIGKISSVFRTSDKYSSDNETSTEAELSRFGKGSKLEPYLAAT
jgi:hypothetical protein